MVHSLLTIWVIFGDLTPFSVIFDQSAVKGMTENREN